MSHTGTQEVPKFSNILSNLANDPTCTLVYTDSDALGVVAPPDISVRYIVTDLKLDPSYFCEPQTLDISKGTELLSYVGPGPSPKSGFHRYVFILFECATTKTPNDRPNWGLGMPGAGVREQLEGQSLKPVAPNRTKIPATESIMCKCIYIYMRMCRNLKEMGYFIHM